MDIIPTGQNLSNFNANIKILKKMKKVIILSIAFALYLSCNAQMINIPIGTKPVIDGNFSTGEWDDAAQASIYVQTDWTVTVFYKHSDTSLYFAFTDVKGVFGERYPDLLLDVQNDKSTAWKDDDWWLHASYNDCESSGEYNLWTSCQPAHYGWSANNFPLVAPGTIEIEVSYQKIGLLPASKDTIGIALEVSDTHTNYHYFPITATIGNPSTWTNAVLSDVSSVQENQEQSISISVYPNPSKAFTIFRFPNPENETYTLTFYNGSGQLMHTIKNVTGNEVKTENSIFAKGMYFFKLQNNNSAAIGKGKLIIE
jgi:hypothetical protein